MLIDAQRIREARQTRRDAVEEVAQAQLAMSKATKLLVLAAKVLAIAEEAERKAVADE